MENKELYLVYQLEGDEYESYDKLLYIAEDINEAKRFKEEWDKNTIYDEKNDVMPFEEFEDLGYGLEENDEGEESIVAKGGHTVEEFEQMHRQWELKMNECSPCRIEKGYTNKLIYEW